MSSDAQFDSRLREIAQAAAPGDSIANDVMQQIGNAAQAGEDGRADPGSGVGPRAPHALRRLAIASAVTGLAAGLLIGIGLAQYSRTQATVIATGPALPIQVASIEGTVLVKRLSGLWTELTPAAPIYVGDVYQAAPQSQLKMTFKDGSWLTLAGGSRLALDHFNGDVQLHLGHGSLKASLNSPHPPFIVATPTGRVEALGTEFTVSVE